MIENFKKQVTDKLAEVGLLVNDDESIFSSEKIIQNESADSLTLVGPNHEAWVFVGAMLPEKDFYAAIEQFITLVKGAVMERIKNRVNINQNISLKDYLEGIAKLLDGTAPTAKLATTPLKDLVAQIHAVQEEPKEAEK